DVRGPPSCRCPAAASRRLRRPPPARAGRCGGRAAASKRGRPGGRARSSGWLLARGRTFELKDESGGKQAGPDAFQAGRSLVRKLLRDAKTELARPPVEVAPRPVAQMLARCDHPLQREASKQEAQTVMIK